MPPAATDERGRAKVGPTSSQRWVRNDCCMGIASEGTNVETPTHQEGQSAPLSMPRMNSPDSPMGRSDGSHAEIAVKPPMGASFIPLDVSKQEMLGGWLSDP
jgi:hypothetical protein